jgi:hypothetical protein
MKEAVARRTFPLAPLQPWTWGLLAALWVVVLLAAFLGGPHAQSPDNPVPWWVVVIFGTALVPAGLLSTLAHRDVSLKGDTLVVSAALIFARKVPVAELDLDKARIVDLGEHTEFRPMLQLGGFALPGFKAGHYLLRNRSRAFCVLTSFQRVLLLTQRNGKQLLLSPEHPQALLDALRQLAPPDRRTPR